MVQYMPRCASIHSLAAELCMQVWLHGVQAPHLGPYFCALWASKPFLPVKMDCRCLPACSINAKHTQCLLSRAS